MSMDAVERKLRDINIYNQSITDLDEIKFLRSKMSPQKSTDLPIITSPLLKKAVLSLFS